MRLDYYTYISCSRCHVGGYVNCPECLGAGGNYIIVPEKEIGQFEKIANSELAVIQRRIELIETLSKYTERTELIVNQDYLTLLNTIYSDHTQGLIKRLEVIRAKLYKSLLLSELEVKIKNIEQVIIKFKNTQPQSIGRRISFEDGFMMVILEISDKYSIVLKKELLIKYLEFLYTKASIRGPFNSIDLTVYGLDTEVRQLNSSKSVLFKYNLNSLTKYFILGKEHWDELSREFYHEWHATNIRGIALRNHR